MRWIGFNTGGALAASLFMLVSVGCGGGGDGGDDSSGQQPQNLAATNIAGQMLTLSGNSTREITLEPDGSAWSENQNGTVRGGTYQYNANGNSAELILSESGASSTVRLAFSSNDSGAFVADQDQGTFRLQSVPEDPNNPCPGDPGGGLAATGLNGRILHGTRTFTSTGPVGQTHVYTFSGTNFHDSDPPEESEGAYNYAPDGDHALLTLAYESPREFNGDRHEMALTFETQTSGTFESTYTRRDGTMIQINGTFRIE